MTCNLILEWKTSQELGWLLSGWQDAACHLHTEKPAGSTYSSTSGLSPLKNSRGKWGFIPLHKTRPDPPVPILQGLCNLIQTSASEVTRGTLRFLPPLEIRTSSIARNPVESREMRPSSTVSLTSQRHPEKLPEVTGTQSPLLQLQVLQGLFLPFRLEPLR